MSGLHTVPDAAEDQQLLLDVRALLERSQRQAAKNRALEAHREKVEATLGRVQESLGAAPRRRDGFEELDGERAGRRHAETLGAAASPTPRRSPPSTRERRGVATARRRASSCSRRMSRRMSRRSPSARRGACEQR